MPPSAVKTPRDERLWDKAKELAAEQGHKENWPYVMGIYQNMKPSTAKTAQRVAARFLQAYVEEGRDPETGWEHGKVSPFQPTQGTGSQTPYPHDDQGKPLPPVERGLMEIPGYTWHDKSKEFHSMGLKKAAESASTVLQRVIDKAEDLAKERNTNRGYGFQKLMDEAFEIVDTGKFRSRQELTQAHKVELEAMEEASLQEMLRRIRPKTASVRLHNPSSPREDVPLTRKESEEAWEAGYEAASYFKTTFKSDSMDFTEMFLWAIARDRRVPDNLREGDPSFWEWYYFLAEGAYAYAQNTNMKLTGIPFYIK